MLLIILGLIAGVIILFIRDFIPSYFFHKQTEQRTQSIKTFRQETATSMDIGEPIYSAERDYENAPEGIDQFRFNIQIPLNIHKTFTKLQLFNTFQVTFLSVGDKISLPLIDGCSVNGFQLPFTVIPELAEGENLPGTYMIRFEYSFIRNPKFTNYANCSVTDANQLIGEKIRLFILNGNTIGIYTIDKIQYD